MKPLLRNKTAGFTLLEIMLVIIIIVLLVVAFSGLGTSAP